MATVVSDFTCVPPLASVNHPTNVHPVRVGVGSVP